MRAEKLQLSEGAEPEEGAVLLPGRVETVDYQGQAARYFITSGGHSLQAINLIDRHPFAEGTEVQIRIRARDVVLLKGE